MALGTARLLRTSTAASKTFEEEYVDLLRLSDVELDEKYLR